MRQCNASARRLPPFLLPLLCAALVALLGLWLLLAPQKEYSPEENRTLTTAPSLTVSSLADGSYSAQLGKFFSDQFPLRSQWVRLRARCESALLRREIGGVLLGKEGYLIPRGETSEAQQNTLRRNLQALATLESKLRAAPKTAAIPLLVAPVPRSVDVNRAHLPDAYQGVDTESIWSHLADGLTLPLTDLRTPLRLAADQKKAVWYKTDHHWTSEGAYLAYVALGESLGYTPYGRDAFDLQTVSTDFLGTTYSRAGLVASECDSITLWRYEGDENYTVTVKRGNGESHLLRGFYDMNALQTKDQYSVFLGGTDACVFIEPPTGEALPTLLLLKDSYAQSLAPLLARHFRLILIDPRSYRAANALPTVTALIEQEQPQAVLLLCGIETLCGEVDLRTLLP